MKAKAILICGKICCGKSTYAQTLRRERGAPVLSNDELMLRLFPVQLGARHEEIAARCRGYLLDRAADLLALGIPVILDWGFWTKESRRAAEEFFQSRGYGTEWHYLAVEDEEWRRRVEKRNREAPAGAYPVDRGLLEKCLALFQPPEPKEIDVWLENEA